MAERGCYRGLFAAIFDDPDFQQLSAPARLVLLTCRLCSQAGAAAIFRFYPEILVRQTGLTPKAVERALQELEQEGWILRDAVVLWVKNGLRYDPFLRLADKKHRKAVERALGALPRVELVLKFCAYYGLQRPFGDPSETWREKSLRIPNTEYREPKRKIYPPSCEPPTPLGETSDNGVPAQAREILEFLNRQASRAFRPVPANLRLIVARLQSGATPEACKGVIDLKARDWGGDPKMAKYLRPETLFDATKFESYLGELSAAPPDEADEYKDWPRA